MKKHPKISVIIPVYNAEPFLRECILSLLSQDFSDFEVILINDGSTDNSYDTAVFFANQDDRIHIISQSNLGVNCARQQGIVMASGDWIVFVDADDVCMPDMLSKLYAATNDGIYDIVKGSIIQDDGKIILHKQIGEVSGKELAEAFVDDRVYGFLYASIYKRSLFNEKMIMPDADLVIGEDILLNMILAVGANNAIAIPEIVYTYRIHPSSVMNKSIIHPDYWGRFYLFMKKNIAGDLSDSFIQTIDKIYISRKIKAFLQPAVPFDKKVFDCIQQEINSGCNQNIKYASFFKHELLFRLFKTIKNITKKKRSNVKIIR